MENKVWIWIFWICIGILILWIILKLIGVIESSVIYDIIPFLTLAFAAGAAFNMLVQIVKKVEKISSRVDRIAYGLTRLEAKVEDIDKRLEKRK